MATSSTRTEGQGRGETSRHPSSPGSGLQEACGLFACVSRGPWPNCFLDVPQVICLGLVALQHRGQESAGIVTGDGVSENNLKQHKGMGLVSTVFHDEVNLHALRGNLGIGHTRYSTAGLSELVNCQPFVVDTIHGRIAVAHNGELINANSLRETILKSGVGLSTTSDSELITQLLVRTPPCGEPDGPDFPARIQQLMQFTPTAYAIVIMHKDTLYAARDPYGLRPLCIGRLLSTASVPNGDINNYRLENNSESVVEGWVVSSESCSFSSIGAEYYRDILPGEIISLTQTGISSVRVVPRPANTPSAFCIFEYVYFSRPDTIHEGQMVYTVRLKCGEQLAVEHPVKADIVSTVPESATPAALGFSSQSKIPYVEVLTKNRYIGRTFIQPSARLRKLGVAKKFGALSENVKGKRVVLIDDSVVRGNTIAPIIQLLRKAGATEIHIRVASPPVKFPCYMGINIPTKEELIANRIPIEKLADFIGADSIKYLSLQGLKYAVSTGITTEESVKKTSGHCTACLSGKYPVSLDW